MEDGFVLKPNNEPVNVSPAPDFRAFFESAPNAILVILPDDPAFTIVAASDEYIRVSGTKREDMVGRSVFDVFPDNPDDPAATGVHNQRQSFARVIATRTPDRLPLQRYDVARPPSGGGGFEERYWRALNSPVLDAEGRVQYILHSVEDITETVRAKQREAHADRERQISDTRFRQMAESNTVGFLLGDLQGGVSYLNPKLRDLLGYTEQDVISGSVRWDRITPPEFTDLGRDALEQLRATGSCLPYETAYFTKTGRRIPILVAPAVIHSSAERPEVGCFVVDLTERKQSERDAFLVQLGDATRALTEPVDIIAAAARLLGDHLGVDRSTYGVYDSNEDDFEVLWNYTRPGVPSVVGRYALSQFGAEAARRLRANLPCVSANVEADFESADVLDSYRRVSIAAHISVPLQKEGRLVAAMSVHQVTPRQWLAEDVELVQLVGSRCWESIERTRVTRALREREQRLRLAQRAGRIGSFDWLFKENRIIWTAELEALYGLAEGAFPGTHDDWGRIVFPEDGIRVCASLEISLARQDAEFADEFRTVLPDGTVRWLRGQGQIFYDENGSPERIVGVHIDIDDQKRAEAMLRDSEQRLRAIFDGTYEYIGLLAPDGTLLEANRASLEFASYQREDVVGRPFWETPWFTHTPGAPEVVREYLGRAANGEFVRFEATIRRPSGEYQTFDISFHPVFDDQGRVSLIVPEGREISERKLAEERLRQQWHTFDAALSNSPDFTYTFDLDGRFTYANRALLSLLQIPFEEILGKNFFDLAYPQELAARLQSQIQRVIETNEPLRDETDFTGPSGETRHYEYIFVPVRADDGSVEAVAGSTRDITERKLAEERERQREEQFRERARLESLGVMAGGVAHDFNNLLTGILGCASLLAETNSQEVRSMAGQITLAAERAAELTNQMLAFSGKGSFAIEAVDLDSLVEENLTLLRASLSRNVTVRLELDGKGSFVDADRAQMQQVVMNLLINASEAIGERPGTVAIRTSVRQLESKFSSQLQTVVPAGDYVSLEVSDNGIGMTPDTQKRIFDPFFTTKFTGRGLGLSAVLGIVKGHKGDIEIESRPGAGTMFRILLPASENPVTPRQKAAPGLTFSASGQTILVVDDESIVLEAASLSLERRGYRVLQAANGSEAIEVLSAHPEVDLVILDLTMPVMTGEQAIPLIKKLRPALPILLSSGFSEAQVTQRFASSGIAGFLQKPYDVSTISAKVAAILQNDRTTPPI